MYGGKYKGKWREVQTTMSSKLWVSGYELGVSSFEFKVSRWQIRQSERGKGIRGGKDREFTPVGWRIESCPRLNRGQKGLGVLVAFEPRKHYIFREPARL